MSQISTPSGSVDLGRVVAAAELTATHFETNPGVSVVLFFRVIAPSPPFYSENNNNNKLLSSRMYNCLQYIWYKSCTIILNLLDRSSIGPRGPSQVMTSTISMINGVNVWRIIVRENKGKPPRHSFTLVIRAIRNKDSKFLREKLAENVPSESCAETSYIFAILIVIVTYSRPHLLTRTL